jgi:heptosyltransferase II
MDGGTAGRRDGGSAGQTHDERMEHTAVPPYRPTALVIQTAFLGDVVLTTPLLSVLAARYGPVDVVTTPAAASLLENHPAVAEVMAYDKKGSGSGWRGLRQMGSLLRARGYQRVYLPHRSLRSAALAIWSGARERIGFSDSPAAITYTRRVSRPSSGHEVERLLSLAGTAAGEAPPVTLGLTPADHQAAGAWLSACGVGPRFTVMAPGSVWATKRWPYYAELASRLDGPSVIVGGREDVALAQAIVATSGGKAFSAAGALSLRQSAALIQRANCLVTNDSAPLHLATAVGTPIVALFGPTVPEFGFGPRRPGDAVLARAELSCRPCSRHGPPACPLGHHRCLKELSVESVARAVATVASAEESRAIRPGS